MSLTQGSTIADMSGFHVINYSGHVCIFACNLNPRYADERYDGAAMESSYAQQMYEEQRR